jgi:3-oxoacyl-[acyl-carrier-protein] synthase II
MEGISDYAKADGPARYNPYFIPKTLVDMASGLISIKYGLKGVNFCPVSACATSNSALVAALHYIRFGYADIIISGGSDAAITPAGIGGFNACKALSTRNADPATASRPFDMHRDGFVMGEGAGALILEEREHALRRGATIYAEIAGGAMNGDAYHMTATHPDGIGAAKAIRLALADGGLQPDDIDYVNAHATSTPVGDLSEINALQHVFSPEGLQRVAISGTKSQTGHLLGAAGAIEAIATVLALHHGVVPPTINTTDLDPALPAGLHLPLGQPLHKPLRAAISNTFGFGGHNAIVAFKRA